MQEKRYEEDEIDLGELFKIIWNKRLFIVIFTFIITFFSMLYVYFKNLTPIYQGNILIEIGEIQSEIFGNSLFDNPQNLSTILNKKFNIDSSFPKRTNNLITISTEDINKEKIINRITDAITYIKKRHIYKSKFYKNSIMTKEIGNIIISSKSINKLIVIVSFVISFISSIFLVFFMSFIVSFRNKID